MAKRCFVLAVLFTAVPFVIFGQTIDEFNAVVDIETTLKELSVAASQGDVDSLPLRFVLIDGAVAAREILAGGTDEFLGQLTLVSGEWIGVERAVKYECVVLLEGPDFAATIPARRTRNPGPEVIQLNDRVMVLGKVLGIAEWEDGLLVPVVQAHHVRKID